MITFEIQLNDRFVYVTAKNEAAALVILRSTMTASQRHWAQPLFTGRNR
jgi:hypothetical protein